MRARHKLFSVLDFSGHAQTQNAIHLREITIVLIPGRWRSVSKLKPNVAVLFAAVLLIRRRFSEEELRCC